MKKKAATPVSKPKAAAGKCMVSFNNTLEMSSAFGVAGLGFPYMRFISEK